MLCMHWEQNGRSSWDQGPRPTVVAVRKVFLADRSASSGSWAASRSRLVYHCRPFSSFFFFYLLVCPLNALAFFNSSMVVLALSQCPHPGQLWIGTDPIEWGSRLKAKSSFCFCHITFTVFFFFSYHSPLPLDILWWIGCYRLVVCDIWTWFFRMP